MKNFKISKNVSMLKKGNLILLWNKIFGGYTVLSCEKFVLLKKLPESQNNFGEKDLERLERLNLIIYEEIDEDKLLMRRKNELINNAVKSSKLRCLELSVSEHCNYKCIYCTFWHNNGKQKNKFMPINLAKKIVNDFLEITKNQKEVVIYFGTAEPLLNWIVIEQIVNMVRRGEKKVSLNLITNGSLVKIDHLKFCQENNVKVGISLDGLPARQRKQRIPIQDNIDSSKIIINLLKSGAKINFKFNCLSATYNEAGFRKDIDYLISLCLKYGIKEFDLDFNAGNLAFIEDVGELIDDLLYGYKKAKKNNLNVFGYWLIPYFNIINDSKGLKSFCGNVNGESVCISSEGEFKLCGYEKRGMSPYSSFKHHLNSNDFKQICKTHLPGANSQCNGCVIEGMCNGHCLLIERGSEEWLRACNYYKASTKRLLFEHF